jgi:MoxR-like ATPase
MAPHKLRYTPQGLDRRDDGVYVLLVEEEEGIHVDELPVETLSAVLAAVGRPVLKSAGPARTAVNRFMADKDVYWLDGVEDRVSDDDEPIGPDAGEDRDDDQDNGAPSEDVSDETDDQSDDDTDDGDESDQGEGETPGDGDESDGEDESESDGDTDAESESEGDGEGEGESDMPPFDFLVRPQTDDWDGTVEYVPAADVMAAIVKALGTTPPAPQDEPPFPQETVDGPTPQRAPRPYAPEPDLTLLQDGGRMYHESEPEVIAAAMGGQHVFLYGPPGTGKSHLAVRYAEMTGQQMDVVSCHPHLTVSALAGYVTPAGLQAGPLLLSARAEGVFLADEVDNTGPGIHASLNSSMANNLIQIQDQRVSIGPAWRVFMTANTMGQGATSDFVGRQKLDAATLDRVASFFIGTDPVLEHNLLVMMGMDGDIMKEWLSIIRRMRDNVDFHGLRCFVSMRTTLAGAKQLLAQRTPEWRRRGLRTLSPMDIARQRVLAKLPADQATKVLD